MKWHHLCLIQAGTNWWFFSHIFIYLIFFTKWFFSHLWINLMSKFNEINSNKLYSCFFLIPLPLVEDPQDFIYQPQTQQQQRTHYLIFKKLRSLNPLLTCGRYVYLAEARRKHKCTIPSMIKHKQNC